MTLWGRSILVNFWPHYKEIFGTLREGSHMVPCWSHGDCGLCLWLVELRCHWSTNWKPRPAPQRSLKPASSLISSPFTKPRLSLFSFWFCSDNTSIHHWYFHTPSQLLLLFTLINFSVFGLFCWGLWAVCFALCLLRRHLHSHTKSSANVLERCKDQKISF